MSLTLAIDFGSSRTKIAYLCPDEGKAKMIKLGQEIREMMPSVFYIPQSGSVLVGDDAAQMADEDPAGIVTDIKRQLHRPGKIRCGEGRPAFQRWELVSKLFSEIRRRCGEEVFHNGSVDSCMLTVPVCFSEPQRQKLCLAAEQAGFTSVRLMDEPTAAAMHWLSSSGKRLSDHVIVVDIGGGTTDLAALKLCGETYEPIPDLPSFGFASGGNDIDEDVRVMIAQDFECSEEETCALLLKLRQVKERLLKIDRDIFTVTLAGRTRTIPRNVVETAVRTLVEKACGETARFLKDFEEVTGQTDTPVLLAGGGSKLAGMKEAMEEVAGADRVFIWNDGEYAIALGAALEGGTNGSGGDGEPGTAPGESSSDLLGKLETVLCEEWDMTKARQQVNSDMVRACELEAKQGHARAQAMLGILYSNEGFPVAKDLNEAGKWFRLSADQDDAYGQVGLGMCYRDGTGVPQKQAEAVKWFRLSADQGNDFGQVCLGMCYQSGTGVSENQKKAVQWFRLSAEKGNALAQVCLGGCFLNGIGVSQNPTEAANWFRLSADQGFALGQRSLGSCYLDGTGVPQNHEEAVKWMRLAAEQGEAEAQFGLGLCYLNGAGVSLSQAEAVKWFRLSADQGNAAAQCHLGIAYFTGDGILQNHTEAVKWLRLGADQGDAEGQLYLGRCYLNGLGVAQNRVEAEKWVRLSADQGNEVAKQWIRNVFLDDESDQEHGEPDEESGEGENMLGLPEVQPDAVLARIVGSKPLPRSEMTKKLWDYIKKNKLQDAKKRTLINADAALKVVFGGKKQVSMFEMTNLVSAHVKTTAIPNKRKSRDQGHEEAKQYIDDAFSEDESKQEKCIISPRIFAEKSEVLELSKQGIVILCLDDAEPGAGEDFMWKCFKKETFPYLLAMVEDLPVAALAAVNSTKGFLGIFGKGNALTRYLSDLNVGFNKGVVLIYMGKVISAQKLGFLAGAREYYDSLRWCLNQTEFRAP